MKTIITLAYLAIIALQYLAISHIGDAISTEAIRVAAMAAVLIIFTSAWLYIAIRILTAREPRTYRDKEFTKVIQPPKKRPLIYSDHDPLHITRG